MTDPCTEVRADCDARFDRATCKCGCGQTPGRGSQYISGHNRCLSPRAAEPYVVDAESGCWNWQWGKSRGGYGVIRVNGKLQRAMRVFYEEAYGPIPEGLHLDHLCRNPACINPEHLEPVTPTENTRRGNTARLNESIVRAIRSMAKQADRPSNRAIARALGVSHPTIDDVVTGKTWRGIEP